ncbi:MAG: J domain-containing protein [Neisseria sp.]|nr:J domain-containing protein [Neisseria sp.]
MNTQKNKIHTHYDNLKVPRDASLQQIRASYRRLCRQYHPDCNPNNADAERIMSLLNRSYAVLSDAEQRAKHDAWIAEQVREHGENKIASAMPKDEQEKRKIGTPLPWTQMLWAAAVLVLILLCLTWFTLNRYAH